VATDSDDLSAWYASAALHWPTSVTNLDAKIEVAERIAERVRDGALIGIGSGSATYMALWAIGRRVRSESLSIRMVTASYETEAAAITLGSRPCRSAPCSPSGASTAPTRSIPTAVCSRGVAVRCSARRSCGPPARHIYLAIDPSKHVERLGQGFPVPIEVDRLAVDLVGRALVSAGARSWELRIAGGKDGPVITESGNLVIDAWFEEIPQGLSGQLKALSGVIETGLFEGYKFEIL